MGCVQRLLAERGQSGQRMELPSHVISLSKKTVSIYNHAKLAPYLLKHLKYFSRKIGLQRTPYTTLHASVHHPPPHSTVRDAPYTRAPQTMHHTHLHHTHIHHTPVYHTLVRHTILMNTTRLYTSCHTPHACTPHTQTL